MTTLEKCTRRIIELIHNLPYDEAIKKELVKGDEIKSLSKNDLNDYTCKFVSFSENDSIQFDTNEKIGNKQYSWVKHCSKKTGWNDGNLIIINNKITIGRVMQAWTNLKHNGDDITCYEDNSSEITTFREVSEILNLWKLTKENGQECTLADQSGETIKAIYNLIK